MKDLLRLIILFLLVRAGLFGLGVLNGRFEYKSDAPNWPMSADGFRFRLIDDRYFDPVIRWDATGYLSIAFEGYGSKLSGQATTAFFPGYPIIGHLAYRAVQKTGLFPPGSFDQPLVAVHVMHATNDLLFMAAVALFYFWSRGHFGADRARRGATLLIVAPASFVFTCMMSEAPFLAVALAAFLLADRGRWRSAAFAAAAATMIRPIGGAILLPLLWRWFVDRRPEERRPAMLWTWFAAAPVAFVTALLLMAEKSGTMRAYFIQQGEYFGHKNFPTLSGITDMFRFAEHSREFIARDLLQLSAFGAIAVAVFLLIRARREIPTWSSMLLMIGVFTLLPALSGGLVSMFRYVIVIFPLYAIFGRVIPEGKRGWLVYGPCLLAQAVLYVLWMHHWGVMI